MNSYITLYVPANYTGIRANAKQQMARVAGGVTHTRAYGTWEESPDAPLVHDDIDLLKSFVSAENLKDLSNVVQALAQQLLAAGEQSVAVEINGELTFVTGSQPKPCPKCGVLIEQSKNTCNEPVCRGEYQRQISRKAWLRN